MGPRVSLSKLDPLDKLRFLTGKNMQIACEHLREISRARGGLQGGLIGREDVLNSLSQINVSPPEELMDAVWATIGGRDDKVSIWKVLSKLPAPRAGRAVERLLERIALVQKSIQKTMEKKKFRQTAELRSTEELFWNDLNTLRLGADGDDSAFKVKERELMKLVDKSTTALMKNNSEAALNNFRDLMKVGHTPTPTPRGSRFMVIDYERPRTHENNMLIDLLAPDSHQNWRGTLRHNHVKMWKEKHDAMERRYQAVMDKCVYQRERAKALAFSKAPFPPQFVREHRADNANGEENTLPRPSTCSSIAKSLASRPTTMASSFAGERVTDIVHDLLEQVKQMGFSLNDVFAVLKTSDGFVDRDKFQDFLRISNADKLGATDKWLNFEALWNFMNRNTNPLIRDLYGRVSVQDAKDAISRVIERSGWLTGSPSWDMDCRSWRHPDPALGITSVSASVYTLLQTIRKKLSLRWHRGVSDAFHMLDAPGKLVGKDEIRAVLNALAIYPTEARFEALWGFLDQANCGKIRWVDFKECFAVPENVPDTHANTFVAGRGDMRTLSLQEGETEQHQIDTLSVSRKVKSRRRKSEQNASRGMSAPSANTLSGPAEEDDLKDLFRSLYDATFSAAIKDATFDKYSKWSPLGRRGYKSRPRGKLRPLSTQSHASDEDTLRHRVHFKTRNVSCQVDEAGDDQSFSHSPLTRTGNRRDPVPTLTPFSNLRNGSNLRMQWRRWTGGETRGASKSSNDDPAAPGATASLLLGAGEFQPYFQRNLDIAKSLERILQKNPDVVFDIEQRRFRTLGNDSKVPTPTGTTQEEMQAFVQDLFPSGLAAGQS